MLGKGLCTRETGKTSILLASDRRKKNTQHGDQLVQGAGHELSPKFAKRRANFAQGHCRLSVGHVERRDDDRALQKIKNTCEQLLLHGMNPHIYAHMLSV